jgi:hypothetical protein
VRRLKAVKKEMDELKRSPEALVAYAVRAPLPRRPQTGHGDVLVPQSGRLGLGISLLSYAGGVMLGVATDQGPKAAV